MVTLFCTGISLPPYPPLLFTCRQFPAILQFSVFLLAYMLLLLVALAEEFKWTPVALQQFGCWIHENNSARNLLTLTAIVINFGLASTDMVRMCTTLKRTDKRFNPSPRTFFFSCICSFCTCSSAFLVSLHVQTMSLSVQPAALFCI